MKIRISYKQLDCEVIVVGILRIVLLSCVYLFSSCVMFYCVHCCTLVAGLQARSQYPERPATGHLGTDFSWFLSSKSKC